MFRLAIPIFALLLATGCSRSNQTTTGEASREATTTGVAFVRYVSNVDAHSATDLYFGDLRLFSTADAKNPTDYKQVPAERRDFILRAANQPTGQPIEKNSEGLSNGKHYTVLVYEDKDAKPVLRVFKDDDDAPQAGKAKLRVIDAAPGAGAITVYAAGQENKLAGESGAGDASSWQEVNPVTGTLQIRAGAGKNNIAATVPDARIEAGKFYTLIVAGNTKAPHQLRVVQVVDAPTTTTTRG